MAVSETDVLTRHQHRVQWPCVFFTPVHTLSTLAWDRLHNLNITARIVGQFHRVINLLLDEDTILALVVSDVGNGPFHIVVERLPTLPFFHGVPLWWDDERLRIGPWALDFGQPPMLWDPMPPWNCLYPRPDRLAELQHHVRQAACTHLTSVVARHLIGEPHPAIVALDLALACNDARAIATAAAQLAGLGPGLTPSGDDFLAGVMVGMQVGKKGEERGQPPFAICHLLFAAAAPRTTRLSRAFLRAASRGYVDERWHVLLTALCGDDPAALVRAARSVLAFGASSGLDMLTGFLWQMERG